jgi:hypothetical protein
LRDRIVHLAGVEPLDFRRRHRRAENAEHRPGMKAARHDGRDELGRHPLHDLVAGGDGREEGLAVDALPFGRRQRGRQCRGAGMGQHAERVPFAAGEDHLGVDESGPGLGQLRAADEHARRPAPARLFLLHQRQRLPARRHVVRDEGRGERLERDALGAVDHRVRQIVVGEAGDKGGELAAERRHGLLPTSTVLL